MGFWHRNVDYHEVIICFRGALRSETKNILIELKVRDSLRFVGDKK